jgi:hypothetical protein
LSAAVRDAIEDEDAGANAPASSLARPDQEPAAVLKALCLAVIGGCGISQMGRDLQRSKAAISNQLIAMFGRVAFAQILQRSRRKPVAHETEAGRIWSRADIFRLAELYQAGLKSADLAIALDRSEQQVRWKIRKIGLRHFGFPPSGDKGA